MKSRLRVGPLRLSEALRQATRVHAQGKLVQAERLYRAILTTIPDQFDALHFLGLARAQQKRFDEAAKLLAAAVRSDPRSFEAHNNLGNALQALGKRQEAIASHCRAIDLNPSLAEAHYNLGIALAGLERHEVALRSFQRALELKPAYPEALCNLGISLQALNQNVEAVSRHREALELRPDFVIAHNNLGSALAALRQFDEALGHFRQAIALQPAFAEAHSNLGRALAGLGHYETAIGSFEAAITIDPHYLPAHANLIAVLGELNRHGDAVAQGRDAIRISPNDPRLLNGLVYSKRRICDWHKLAGLEHALVRCVQSGRTSVDPHIMLSITDAPDLHLQCARLFSEKLDQGEPLLVARPTACGDRIRLAYLSADFRAHATSHLAVRLFELHDRSKFEVYGLSFGPDDASDMRRRVANAFDRFIDIRDLSDEGAASLMRDLKIDIAIDLNGHTRHARLGILALRPAPVQVHYLGYPGTLGARFLDYLIVDPIVAPSNGQAAFGECLAYLPDSYFVTSYSSDSSAATSSREANGLPENEFVFCCFNNTYKLTLTVFEIWMRLLAAVPGSVLWLLSYDQGVEENLRREASDRGFAPHRLVFSPPLPFADHLERHRHADLFLDTFPCGAHTTACDALWAGLPIVTCAGQSLVSRGATSILHAAGLPELATHNLAAYEALALRLATHPELLSGYRRRLCESRGSAPLFDTARLARNLEAVYEEMWRNWRCGQPPRTFSVRPDLGASGLSGGTN